MISRKVFYEYLSFLQENIHAKVWLQLYWNHTSTWFFFFKYATYLQQNAFFREHMGTASAYRSNVINLETLSKQVKTVWN